jgi:hypothetical protein
MVGPASGEQQSQLMCSTRWCCHMPGVNISDSSINVAAALLQEAALGLERALLDGGPCKW